MKISAMPVGKEFTVKVMGIINTSPESFYKGSVKTDEQEIAATARQMQEDGAHMIDIGGMSTAPYVQTRIVSIQEEIRRVTEAIKVVKSACDLPISADTPRAAVAEEAIAAGADTVNDVTGLKYDSKMADIAAKADVSMIIGAYSKAPVTGKLVSTLEALNKSMRLASEAGIKDVMIDPSIGFFRQEGKNPFFTKMTDMPWYARDIEILSNLHKLATLKKPICVSVSRKSFIGYLLNLNSAEDRLIPSIACEMIAALNGANIIRTHNVRETVQAVTMLQLLRT
ncbi:MAG: dihydropteroate synthase [Thermoproteota archaeon]|nr:dihydropteroate synthase [Thermoproteota archaeon]